MNKRLSAIDAISPAFNRTGQLLFQPFRLGVWARLGLIALTTGEFAGGGGAANVNIPAGGGTPKQDFLAAADPVGDFLRNYFPWILGGVIALVALGLLALFISSVFRFILLDAVLRDRPHLREGWRRWQEPGGNYFLWQLGFLIVSLVALGAVVGVPVFLAWRAGVFQQPDRYVGLLIAGGILLFFVVIGLLLALLLIDLFAKDFLIPLMAMENLGVFAAWRRLLPLLAAEKLACTGYVLMKVVLTVGSAILFGILNLIVFLVLFVVFGIAGAALILGGKATGLEWNLTTILIAVALGSIALGLLLYIISFVSSPAMVFFQSYALYFLGGRYPLLEAQLSQPFGPRASPTPTPPPALESSPS
jgi:hypothetical protein